MEAPERAMVAVDRVRRAAYRAVGRRLRAHVYCDTCAMPITGLALRGNDPDEALCHRCWETVAWIRGPLRAARDDVELVECEGCPTLLDAARCKRDAKVGPLCDECWNGAFNRAAKHFGRSAR